MKRPNEVKINGKRLATWLNSAGNNIDGNVLNIKVIEKVDFSKYDFNKKHFANITFNYCRFEKAEFAFAAFENCIFNGCNFESADMYGCYITKSDFTNCKFWYAVMLDATITESTLSLDNFSGANVRTTTVKNSNLAQCNFSNSNLTESVFMNSAIRMCSFDQANLCKVLFNNVGIQNSSFRVASLVRASFDAVCFTQVSDFEGANFFQSYFYDTNLNVSNMLGANLSSAIIITIDKNPDSKKLPFMPMVCPEEGSFIAWKKVWCPELKDYILAKLEIPANAKRCSGTGRKCRASRAKVLEFQTVGGKKLPDTLVATPLWGFFYGTLTYKVGKTVVAKNFDPNRWQTCSRGIHFFLTKDEAKRYQKQ